MSVSSVATSLNTSLVLHFDSQCFPSANSLLSPSLLYLPPTRMSLTPLITTSRMQQRMASQLIAIMVIMIGILEEHEINEEYSTKKKHLLIHGGIGRE